MLQHRKGSKTYQKGYSQFYHRDPSKEIISLNSCSIECNSRAKAEYICINVLYPFHLCFLRRNCLWFVTLLVRKKKMLNRCFPYQQSLQIPSTFHPVLIKSSPGHKRANTLIRQGSGKKNKPHREGTFSSLFYSDFPSQRREGTSGRGGHISAGMRNNLSRWWMINTKLHVGGRTKRCRLPLGWLYSCL